MDIKNLKKISKAVNIGTKEYYDYIVRKCVQTIEEIPKEMDVLNLYGVGDLRLEKNHKIC